MRATFPAQRAAHKNYRAVTSWWPAASPPLASESGIQFPGGGNDVLHEIAHQRSSSPSPITRVTGSVPDLRTSTRPVLPFFARSTGYFIR